MNRIAISFSGGRTSAVMTKMLVEKLRPTHEITVNFANTGCEHLKTLEFVDKCDKAFGFNCVWLEAVIDPRKGEGVRHKIVNFETASRDGKPFEDFIAKYGIPNMTTPQCTTRLKENVMDSYRHGELGWARRQYDTAVGIRADEAHRARKDAAKERFIYPLLESGWTKDMVVSEVRSWGFDLEIPEQLGNCTWCWKKSNRKLLTLAKENPEVFEFPLRMEDKYSGFKCDSAAVGPDGKRNFFRGHRSALDLLELSKMPFEAFEDKYSNVFDPVYDLASGCGMSSCEVGVSDQ